jgi:hypothetical protein
VSPDRIRITRPLLSVLLELAADADPRSVNVLLVATAAGDLEADPDVSTMDPVPDGHWSGADTRADLPLSELEPETPVYSDFYFPDVGNAVRNVFGIDLGTPPGQAHGRFLSHPTGDPEMSVRDDLHAVVLVAIPPWTPENVAAYDRRSRRCELDVVAAGVLERDFEG